jgi:hypothetical protein
MYRLNWLKASVCLAAAGVAGFVAWWGLSKGAGLQPATAGILAACIAGVIAITHAILTHAIEMVNGDGDRERIELFRMAFDRPAFRTSFANELAY